MIDTVYQIVKVILNKELRGNITPSEFNFVAKQVQDEMLSEYFGEINLQVNKQNRGLTNKDYADLVRVLGQKIDVFSSYKALTYDPNTESFPLPNDLYLLKPHGLDYRGSVIELADTASVLYLTSSLSAPSTTFPVYEHFGNTVKVHPDRIHSGVSCRYIRKPKDPKWTYRVVAGMEFFDNTALDFQDFELHHSELPNIAINMLSYLGVNIGNSELVSYVENLKTKEENKEQK